MRRLIIQRVMDGVRVVLCCQDKRHWLRVCLNQDAIFNFRSDRLQYAHGIPAIWVSQLLFQLVLVIRQIMVMIMVIAMIMILVMLLVDVLQ